MVLALLLPSLSGCGREAPVIPPGPTEPALPAQQDIMAEYVRDVASGLGRIYTFKVYNPPARGTVVILK